MILARWPERPRGAPDAVVFVPPVLGWAGKKKDNRRNGQKMRGGSIKMDFDKPNSESSKGSIVSKTRGRTHKESMSREK